MKPLRVVYVAGAGRSGSTLVDNVLGETDGFFSAGEVVYFWRRFLIEGRRCGCRKRGVDCEVWSRVIELLGQSSPVDGERMVRALSRGTRIRHTPLLATGAGRSLIRRRVGVGNVQRLRRLYESIQEVTGARVIVDSSKFPGYGFLVAMLPDVDVHVVHLIRDPRAVAFSWLRKKEQPDTEQRVFMMRRSIASVAPRWVAANLAAEVLWRGRAERYTRLTYEAFIDSPHTEISRVLDEMGEGPPPAEAFGGGRVNLSPNHTVSGNPSRFVTGKVELRLDDQWVRDLSAAKRRFVSAVTLPLLRRYGYRVGST